MSTQISKFFGEHQQQSPEKLVQALSGFSAAKNSVIGKSLLRLTKQGIWVFGQESEALAAGQQLIVNPFSLSSGYVAWYQGAPEDEVMQPLSVGPVDASKLRADLKSGTTSPGKTVPSGKGWESQASVELLIRDDVPLHLIYKTSSNGGLQALLGLAGAIAYGMVENPKRAFPVISLGVSSYVHKEYGEVFKPELNIVAWLDASGDTITERTRLV